MSQQFSDHKHHVINSIATLPNLLDTSTTYHLPAEFYLLICAAYSPKQ